MGELDRDVTGMTERMFNTQILSLQEHCKAGRREDTAPVKEELVLKKSHTRLGNCWVKDLQY